LHFPIARRQPGQTITTLHSRLDIPDIQPLYGEFDELPLVSISRAQRRPMPWANWVGTVYHGLPEDLYHACTEPGTYLAFVGRVSREKRLDRAIEIALRVGMPLKIAAKIDPADRDYFESCIRKHLSHPLIEFLGELGDTGKSDLLRKAYALLFPIDWPEPFGLVMIEALACGTPVIAYRAGSVPEVIEDGKTGYVVDNLDEAVEAVGRIRDIDRRTCRQVFEQRFSARRMCADYTALYLRLDKARMRAGGAEPSVKPRRLAANVHPLKQLRS
jgi:glycosyltransferase involved in cell wall biosynthesis